MLTQLGIMFNDNTNQAVPPSPLSQRKLPKKTASFSCVLPPFLVSSVFSGLSEENLSQ